MTSFFFINKKLNQKKQVLKSAKDSRTEDYLIPTQKHRDILRRLTKNNPGKIKEYYSVALEELVLQQGPYKVAAEISDKKVICYCCYHNRMLVNTIYEENEWK